MKNIVTDLDGNVIDELEVRNKEIKSNLEGVLQDFIDEKNMLLAMKKQPKLGYRFMKMIMLELAKYPSMSLANLLPIITVILRLLTTRTFLCVILELMFTNTIGWKSTMTSEYNR